MPAVTLHGHRVSYLEAAGDGPVVVLLHGIAGSSAGWQPVLERLRGHARVIAPDLLGHGGSAKPRGDYSLGAYASGLRDLLELLDVETATVVGHSLGGGVALQYAYQYWQRCERLVLVCSGGLGRDVGWPLRAASLPGAELVLPALANSGRCAPGAPPAGRWSWPASRSAARSARWAAASPRWPRRPPGRRSCTPCAQWSTSPGSG